MPQPIYIPEGHDPTEEEYPIPGTGLATFMLACLAVVGIGFAFFGGIAVARGKAPTATSTHTATSTATNTSEVTNTRQSRVYHITFTPTTTLTPSATSTGTLTPSFTPSPTLTPSLTPSKTPTYTRTPRPTRQSRRSNGGNAPGTPDGFEISVAEATISFDGGLGGPLGPYTMVPVSQGGVTVPEWTGDTPTETAMP